MWIIQWTVRNLCLNPQTLPRRWAPHPSTFPTAQRAAMCTVAQISHTLPHLSAIRHNTDDPSVKNSPRCKKYWPLSSQEGEQKKSINLPFVLFYHRNATGHLFKPWGNKETIKMEEEGGGTQEGNNPKALINKTTSDDSPVSSGGESIFSINSFEKTLWKPPTERKK